MTAGAPLSFTVAVYDPGHNEVERQPGSRPVELTVPDERFEARNWSGVTTSPPACGAGAHPPAALQP